MAIIPIARPGARSFVLNLEQLEVRRILTFLAPTGYPAVGNAPEDATVADFNGDGALDIAVSIFDPGFVNVMLGKGDGTFLPGRTFAAGTSAFGIEGADFDRDGIVDIVTANYNAMSISVLIGNGDGTFQSKHDYATGEPQPHRVAVGDVNGDGSVDVATTNLSGTTISVFLGNGDGSFMPAKNMTVGLGPWGIKFNDLDLDGIDDITVSCQQGKSLVVILSGGGGGVYSTSTNNLGHTIADVNHDHYLDAMITNTNYTMEILLGNGDGTFRPIGASVVPDFSQNPEAADFNRDRRIDIAVVSLSGTFGVLLGNGDGSFQPAIIHPLRFSDGMAAADLDGDRYPDAVVPSWFGDTVWVYQNDTNWTTPIPSAHFAEVRTFAEETVAIGVRFRDWMVPTLTRFIANDSDNVPTDPSTQAISRRARLTTEPDEDRLLQWQAEVSLGDSGRRFG